MPLYYFTLYILQTRRNGKRRGTGLKDLGINYILIYTVVELAIIRGTREIALYKGLIKSAFLMDFYYCISLNITLLSKP
jgi:hypothetical protein